MEKPQPDTTAAIEFLLLWEPDGPWALTAIAPDKKSIITRTFYKKDLPQLEEWLKENNGKRNIYFHVNRLLTDIRSKAQREDVAEVTWLHVDIDPRVGEDLYEERERALTLLRSPPGRIPPATCIVFSGGGLQGFWKLEKPIPINGDLTLAEEAKRYNQQLEIEFGGDNCHNIDRIMRLPGTINIPDERKRKKGREETLAKLIEFDKDKVYPLELFTVAPLIQSHVDSGFAGSSVQISGNVERITSVEELNEWNVPDRVKMIIVQGEDPDNPKEGDNSRSAWLFDAVCQLVRHEVPDDVIFSIITDPDDGIRISNCVLDKGRNAERYAIRQIERAKEFLVDPWLMKLNAKYAVIQSLGGRCRIIGEVMDHALKRPKLIKMSFEDFANYYRNEKVKVGIDPKTELPRFMSVGKWWLDHKQRRQYETVVFCPNTEVERAYNLWKGFGVEPREGDCSRFLGHLKEIICQNNETHYNYLLNWMARAVQHPDEPGEVAVVLRGGRGTGKGTFAKLFGDIWGRHALQVTDPKHLTGSFNSHLRDCVVLYADEAFYAGDKKHESILKAIITESTVMIEGKGVDAETYPNYLHIIMASNDQWVVPAGADERRFFVLDVADTYKQNTKYFKEIRDSMRDGGYSALLYLLLNRDISEFDVRSVPQTAALHDQKMLSLDPEEEWWHQKLMEGSVLDGFGWRDEIIKDNLWFDYCEYMRALGVNRRTNKTAWGKFMSRICPSTLHTNQKMVNVEVPDKQGYVQMVKRRKYIYVFPPLDECRAHWSRLFGAGEEWPHVVENKGDEELDHF